MVIDNYFAIGLIARSFSIGCLCVSKMCSLSATSDFPAYEFRKGRLEAVSLIHKIDRLRLGDDGKI